MKFSEFFFASFLLKSCENSIKVCCFACHLSFLARSNFERQTKQQSLIEIFSTMKVIGVKKSKFVRKNFQFGFEKSFQNFQKKCGKGFFYYETTFAFFDVGIRFVKCFITTASVVLFSFLARAFGLILLSLRLLYY